MWLKIGCFLLSMVSVQQAFALVQGTIDGKKPLQVYFSSSSHNRIAVENGFIEKVVGNGSFFSVTIDPSTGNAFVHVLQEIENVPETLSVVTSSGAVQDLFVLSHPGVSEQVVLQEKEGKEFFQLQPSLAFSVDTLQQIFAGKIPLGYGQVETVEDSLPLPEPLATEVVKGLEGPFELLTLYRITNQGEETIVLSTHALQQEEETWVLYNTKTVHPGESALCIVGKKKSETGS